MTWRWWHFLEHTIGFDADAEFVFERFEVNVAGVILDRQQQHHVQQLLHRSTVGQFGDVGQVDRTVAAKLCRRFFEIIVFFEIVDDLCDAVSIVVEILVDRFEDLSFGGDLETNLVTQETPQFILHSQVLRITGGQRQDAFVQLQRHHAIQLSHFIGDRFARFVRRSLEVLHVDRLQAKLFGQRLDQLFVVDQAHINGNTSNQTTALRLLFHEHFELIVVDRTKIDQNLT